ncbi:hypothetical protein AB5N19_12852 [Seiridium cardinale]|uniref:Uncharacterized protein n=1 Tax=Seiridium cardinale TaxID=138064 RepID=A0ABR2Y078_9PEZI
MEEIIWRRALQAPLGARSAMPHQRTFLRHAARQYSSAPTVTQPSFWKSLIPKFWRPKEKRPDVNFGPPMSLKKPKKKDWNPATYYIVMFLFVGSMSIQMISLKRDFSTHMRRAETRIGILREVVEKLQRGEEVDVEKALGTGDAAEEKEWAEVLKDIEQDDAIRSPKRADRPRHASSTRSDPKPEPKSQQEPAADKSKTSTANFAGFY